MCTELLEKILSITEGCLQEIQISYYYAVVSNRFNYI